MRISRMLCRRPCWRSTSSGIPGIPRSRLRPGSTRSRATRSSTRCAVAGAREVEPLEDFEEFLAAPEAEDPHALSDARKLLETLAPRQRDIVTSISLDGQSIAATAKRLAMSEVAVRVALHRALKSLGAAWRRSVT